MAWTSFVLRFSMRSLRMGISDSMNMIGRNTGQMASKMYALRSICLYCSDVSLLHSTDTSERRNERMSGGSS